MKTDKIQQGIGEAFAEWLNQYHLTTKDLFLEAIEKAVGKWMNDHEEEILDMIAEAALKHAPIKKQS